MTVMDERGELIKRNLYAWREMQGSEEYRCFADVMQKQNTSCEGEFR